MQTRMPCERRRATDGSDHYQRHRDAEKIRKHQVKTGKLSGDHKSCVNKTGHLSLLTTGKASFIVARTFLPSLEV